MYSYDTTITGWGVLLTEIPNMDDNLECGWQESSAFRALGFRCLGF